MLELQTNKQTKPEKLKKNMAVLKRKTGIENWKSRIYKSISSKTKYFMVFHEWNLLLVI